MSEKKSEEKKGFVPKVKTQLVIPQLKMSEGVPIYIQPEGAIFVGKELKTTGETKEKPADLMNCINMETGERCVIIVAAIVKSTLEEAYPEAGYVGKGFAIKMGAVVEGKRYRTYSIDEIEV